VARSAEQIANLLRQCIEEGISVEIDGLGVFRPRPGGYEFYPFTAKKVFIAYVVEDRAPAVMLYDGLRANGFDPWLDCMKLLPGQDWPRSIERAIEVSDFFVACLSRRAVHKRGQFPAELRYALDCARRQPLDRVFFIPVRFEECAVPARISRETQYVDLFPDWHDGFQRVLATMNAHGATERLGPVRRK
jgi:hypothetical protein